MGGQGQGVFERRSGSMRDATFEDKVLAEPHNKLNNRVNTYKEVSTSKLFDAYKDESWYCFVQLNTIHVMRTILTPH